MNIYTNNKTENQNECSDVSRQFLSTSILHFTLMKLEDVVGGEERCDETNTMAERRVDVNILLRARGKGILNGE